MIHSKIIVITSMLHKTKLSYKGSNFANQQHPYNELRERTTGVQVSNEKSDQVSYNQVTDLSR